MNQLIVRLQGKGVSHVEQENIGRNIDYDFRVFC